MTPDSLYAALDEPNADIDLILGLIADWYADHCDERREAACRWMVAMGKRPCRAGWFSTGGPKVQHRLPLIKSDADDEYLLWYQCGHKDADNFRHAVDALADQWPAEVSDWWQDFRTRGEEPVAGIAEEVTT